MTALQKFLAIVLALGAIGGAIYKFDICKVERKAYATFVAGTQNSFLVIHRREIQQRIWDIQRQYPSTYQNMREYQRLVEELRHIDMKIKAYYHKGGK